MKIKCKRFDQEIPLPARQTAGSVGFDLHARISVKIEPGKIAYIPLNFALSLPSGYWALVAARSSLHKKGLMLANSVGIGDADFCGEDDEYKAAVYNFNQETVEVIRGERICQLIILTHPEVELEEVRSFGGQKNRGGFGSTGK